jgi:hypothetical protein
MWCNFMNGGRLLCMYNVISYGVKTEFMCLSVKIMNFS